MALGHGYQIARDLPCGKQAQRLASGLAKAALGQIVAATPGQFGNLRQIAGADSGP